MQQQISFVTLKPAHTTRLADFAFDDDYADLNFKQ